MCTEGSLGAISEENPYHSCSSPTDDICPKPPTIANGYVEHAVRYGCQEFYQLRSEGDGKIASLTLRYAWGQGPKIVLLVLVLSSGIICPFEQALVNATPPSKTYRSKGMWWKKHGWWHAALYRGQRAASPRESLHPSIVLCPSPPASEGAEWVGTAPE